MTPHVSVVVPAYNEGRAIVPVLDRVFSAVETPCEVLVVYDFPQDTTAPVLDRYHAEESRLRPLLSTYGRGPARAIKYGLHHAQGDVVVVTMGDGSDEVEQIDELVRRVDEGAVIAAASRYMEGGSQVGGPRLKKSLSRAAGVSLYWLGRVGTHDATSSFKAYSKAFVNEVGIESDHGFEIGIELVAKARRRRLPVAEIPTTWHDRTQGESNFKMGAWLPRYIRWYVHALGPPQRREARV